MSLNSITFIDRLIIRLWVYLLLNMEVVLHNTTQNDNVLVISSYLFYGLIKTLNAFITRIVFERDVK